METQNDFQDGAWSDETLEFSISHKMFLGTI